jgi:hypothetical protein
VSYFTAPWVGLVVYPRFLDLLAATLATVLVAFWVLASSVRRGHSSWAGLGASGLAAVAAVTLAAVACQAGWWLVRACGARTRSEAASESRREQTRLLITS